MVVASSPPPTVTVPGRTSVTVPRNTRAADDAMPPRSKCLTVVASSRGIGANDEAINLIQKATLSTLISSPLLEFDAAQARVSSSTHSREPDELALGWNVHTVVSRSSGCEPIELSQERSFCS